VSVSSISASASDRLNQLLNGTLDVSTRAPVDSARVRDCAAASASSYGCASMPPARAVSHTKLIEITRVSLCARCRAYCTLVPVSESGGGSQWKRRRRRT
jgi:hypothetical protein